MHLTIAISRRWLRSLPAFDPDHSALLNYNRRALPDHLRPRRPQRHPTILSNDVPEYAGLMCRLCAPTRGRDHLGPALN